MKPSLSLLAPLSILAGALVLASCGGGGGSGPSTTSGNTTAGTTSGNTTAGTTAGTTSGSTTSGNTTAGTTSGSTTSGTTAGNTTAGGTTSGGTGPLSGQIAFISTRGSGNGDIYAMDANGGNQRALTALNSSNEERSPSISPDGKTIIWSSNKPNKAPDLNYEIYIQRVDPSDPLQTRIIQESYTNDPFRNSPDDTEPVISPDGARIAWTTERFGSKNIAVMDIGGGNQKDRLTDTNLGEDSQPTWSSNSQQIAFYSVRGNTRGIYVMNADGSGQTPLLVSDASSDVRYSQPVYAPNGGRFAVTIETGNGSGSTISLRNADGTPVANDFNAGSGFIFRSQPNFSRDGTRLIYVASNSNDGRGQIYTANLDGSGERPLTSAGQNFDARFSN